MEGLLSTGLPRLFFLDFEENLLPTPYLIIFMYFLDGWLNAPYIISPIISLGIIFRH